MTSVMGDSPTPVVIPYFVLRNFTLYAPSISFVVMDAMGLRVNRFHSLKLLFLFSIDLAGYVSLSRMATLLVLLVKSVIQEGIVTGT